MSHVVRTRDYKDNLNVKAGFTPPLAGPDERFTDFSKLHWKEGDFLKKTRKTQKKANAKTAISYHMKCAKTANGLTHFVMYGDVPKKKMPL